MKTIIQLPSDVEIKGIKIDEKTRTIEIDHRFLTVQSAVPAAYLTCRGNGGMQKKAILFVSGKSGRFQVIPEGVEGNPAFDLPKEKFQERSDKMQKRLKGGGKKTKTETPDTPTPTQSPT